MTAGVIGMSARTIRMIVVVVCVLGIAGMIVTSIADNVGAAVTFGLITAAAILCSIVATAVTTAPAAPLSAPVADEAQAERVEELVQRLIDNGTDEGELRRLVGAAVRLGRGMSRTTLSGG